MKYSILVFLTAFAGFANSFEVTCFPQYNLNACKPTASLAATIYFSGSAPEVFIQKYQPGITLGIFSASCTGTLETSLECVNSETNSRFLTRRIGHTIAATFDGDPAAKKTSPPTLPAL